MWEDNWGWTFSLKEALFCIILPRSDGLELRIDGLDYLWIVVMFLSAVWTHSDGTHSLQMIHLWASDVMLS